MTTRDVFVGLDIGSTTITAVAAARSGCDLRVLGAAAAPNIDASGDSRALRSAIAALVERVGGRHDAVVQRVSLSVSGARQQRLPASAECTWPEPTLVQPGMIESMRRRALRGPSQCGVVLASVSRGWSVDGFPLSDSTAAVYGRRLKVEEQVWVAPHDDVEERARLLEGIGLEVDTLIPRAVASAEAVLRPEERARDAVVVDIGGMSTDVVVYLHGQLRELFSVPIGGRAVTSDLAYILGIPAGAAERLKLDGLAEPAYAQCVRTALPSGGRARPTGVRFKRGGSETSSTLVAPFEIAAARTFELFHRIRQRLDDLGVGVGVGVGIDRPIGLHRGECARVVVTGGGAQLRGMEAVARRATGLPVRVARPSAAAGPQPVLGTGAATALGVVLAQARLRPVEVTETQELPWLEADEYERDTWQHDDESLPPGRSKVGPALGRWLREFVPLGEEL